MLGLTHTSSTILLTNGLVSGTGTRTRISTDHATTSRRTRFHHIGNLRPKRQVPPGLHNTFGRVTGGSSLGQLAAHHAHSMLSHTLGSVTSVCRSITMLRGGTRSSIKLVGLRGQSTVARLSMQLGHTKTITHLSRITRAHGQLTNGNGPLLIFRSLFYTLVPWNSSHHPVCSTSYRSKTVEHRNGLAYAKILS